MDSSHLSQSSDHTLIYSFGSNEQHFQDNSSPPNLETILSGSSLAPYSRVAFMDFLRKLHCAENLEFLINSDQYLQHARSPEETEYILQEREQLWSFIYNTFISEESPKELNIPHEIKIKYRECGGLPSPELIELTNQSIKDLIRDVYLQFLQHVRKSIENHSHKPKHITCDKINEHYSLLPTPIEEFATSEQIFTSPGRRFSENCSPLDPPAASFSTSGIPFFSRCNSPLSSGSDIALHDAKSHSLSVPRTSAVHFSSNSSEDLTRCSKEKKKSVSEQTGLKKFAEKLRWRRLSSNSSTSSS